jgi:putative DNA primase/helicase
MAADPTGGDHPSGLDQLSRPPSGTSTDSIPQANANAEMEQEQHDAVPPSVDALRADPDPLQVFRALCEAIALRYRAGDIEHHSYAADEMYAIAIHNGIVKLIGEDAVQAIMGEAFKRYPCTHRPHPSVRASEPIANSEDWLAVEFTARHRENWRYVAQWGWLEWDGVRWQRDRTLRAVDLARDVCVHAASVANSERTRLRLSSASAVGATVALARTDRAHAVTTDIWDADPWTLNTPGGTLDLRNGKLRSHERTDYCTKVTAATPRGICPTWLAFLQKIMNGDDDVVAYWQRVCGYALTGLTLDQVMFFLYGAGGNGKTVTTNIIGAVLGDYSVVAPTDMLMATRTEQHPTDIAGLRGVRLAIATETEQGRRWAEAKVKKLTGGDKLTARFMRQDFFEFVPTHKLLVSGNHKPGLRSFDEAIRRRLHLIPFNVTIPPSERDTKLTEKLLAERDGILRWAVEGCLAWQRVGLQPPATVRAATDSYFEGADAVGRWLDECVELDPQCRTTTTRLLFKSWSGWCERNGEPAGTTTTFGEALNKRGFDKWKSKHERGYAGLRLADTGDYNNSALV